MRRTPAFLTPAAPRSLRRALVLLALGICATSPAQNLSGHFLRPEETTFIVGTDRAEVALAANAAAAQWNAALENRIRLKVEQTSGTVGPENGVNEIYFAKIPEDGPDFVTAGQTLTSVWAAPRHLQDYFPIEVDIQVNADIEWTPEMLVHTLLHEMGHALGFRHPDEIGIEWPSVVRSGYRDPSPEITAWDEMWVQSLYENHPRMALLLGSLELASSRVWERWLTWRKDSTNPGKGRTLQRAKRRLARLQRHLDMLATLALQPTTTSMDARSSPAGSASSRIAPRSFPSRLRPQGRRSEEVLTVVQSIRQTANHRNTTCVHLIRSNGANKGAQKTAPIEEVDPVKGWKSCFLDGSHPGGDSAGR